MPRSAKEANNPILLKVQSLQLSFRPAGVSLGGGGGAKAPLAPPAYAPGECKPCQEVRGIIGMFISCLRQKNPLNAYGRKHYILISFSITRGGHSQGNWTVRINVSYSRTYSKCTHLL